MGNAWRWDPTLYSGSAAFYARGRVAYPPALADEIAEALDLDGRGRLLDVGCGPGSIALLLSPRYAEVVGVDADPDMLLEAQRLAQDRGIRNAIWRQLRAEELPSDLGTFRTVVFAQSFHWMDRPRVAETVRGMLEPPAALVHVHASTHRGGDDVAGLTGQQPPYNDIDALIARYLGADRRAGQGILPTGTPGNEGEIYAAAGFAGPERWVLPSWVVERSVDDLVASTFSLSSSAPHLFGERLGAFEGELRALLLDSSSGGTFTERISPIAFDVWRLPGD